MTEIQGKSFLVQVSAWFELARVQVIGSRLYLITDLLSLIETVDMPSSHRPRLNGKLLVTLRELKD